MVEKRNDARLVALVDKLLDQISPAGGMRRVEIVKPLRIVKRKTVVMTGREGDIFTPRRFRRFYKVFRPGLFYVEPIRQPIVFFPIRLRVRMQIPFPFADNAVQTEMDK